MEAIQATSSASNKLRIAIVGGGVSGLAAFWLLNEQSPHSVDLYEKRDNIGGDAHSITFNMGKKACQVETWVYILHAEGGCGVFVGELITLDVPRWRLLYDIFRFNYQALAALSQCGNQSSGDFLAYHEYSNSFKWDYLYPLMAAVLSIPYLSVPDIPVSLLARIMHNMCLLQLWNKPTWKCVREGSVNYINRIISGSPQRIHRKAEVARLERTESGWLVQNDNGAEEFDHIILTGPPRGILKILRASDLATPLAQEILGGLCYSHLEIWIHQDQSFLPLKPFAAGWNIAVDDTTDEKGRIRPVEITFDVNRLQNYPREEYGLILGTQDPCRRLDPSKVHSKHSFSHPLHDAARYSALENLPGLQRELAAQGISIAGAWMGYGIHENGWTAGLEAAISLGGKMPFPLVSSDRPVQTTWLDTLMLRFFDLADRCSCW